MMQMDLSSSNMHARVQNRLLMGILVTAVERRKEERKKGRSPTKQTRVETPIHNSTPCFQLYLYPRISEFQRPER